MWRAALPRGRRRGSGALQEGRRDFGLRPHGAQHGGGDGRRRCAAARCGRASRARRRGSDRPWRGRRGVAVDARVDRADAAGQAVVGRRGQLGGVLAAEGGVGDDDADGGVAERRRRAPPSRVSIGVKPRPRTARTPATMRPLAGSTTSPKALTAMTASTRTAPAAPRAMPMPPAELRAPPAALPTLAPVPAPTAPSAAPPPRAAAQAAQPGAASGRPRDRRCRDRRARRRRRSGCRRGRSPARRRARTASARRRRRPPGRRRCRRQHRAMHVARLDPARQFRDLRLTRTGPTAAHRHPADRAGGHQHHRAAGGAGRIGPVADQHPEGVGRPPRRPRLRGCRDRAGAPPRGDDPVAAERRQVAAAEPVDRRAPQCRHSACGCSGGTMRSPRPAMIRTRWRSTRSG